MSNPNRPNPAPRTDQVIDRNVRALMERRRLEEEAKKWQVRLADAIARFAGSMPFVYLHVAIFGVWVVINLPWSPDRLRFDPTYVVLAMFASVEAIFLSTFVLITQNRMAAMAAQRADLDLQISLLSEHEITRVVKLVTEIADRLGIEEARNPELKGLAEEVRPENVLDQLEHRD